MGVSSGSKIKSIQRGVVTVANTNTSSTATISSVNVNKSMLQLVGVSGGDGTPYYGCLALELTNSTTITASRFAGAYATDATFQVTEYY